MGQIDRVQHAVWGAVAALCLGVPAVMAQSEVQDPLTERTIYIPYERFRQIFEREGRGIFLPYEEFRALWELARQNAPPAVQVEPPSAVLIRKGSYQAEVVQDVVHVTAQIDIEVLKTGWVEVPLRLIDAAITHAEMGGRPARLLYDPTHGYTLLAENKATEGHSMALELGFAKAFTQSPGRHQVSFEAPAAPVSQWTLRIPEPGVHVDVQPMIATSVQGDEVDRTDTLVTAFVGAAPTVSFAWTQQSQGATGLDALVAVRSEQRVFVDESILRSSTTLTYDISRSQIDELSISVPANHRIVNVFDANVRAWRVETEGDEQRLHVTLFDAITGKQQLQIDTEFYWDAATAAALSVPAVVASDVARQEGLLAVRVSPALRANAGAKVGLLQTDRANLPEVFEGQWDLAYRYATTPYALDLKIEEIEPQVSTSTRVEIACTPDEIRLGVVGTYDVRRAGVFELTATVPRGYSVTRVRGLDIPDGGVAIVDRWDLDEPTGHLTMQLSRKAEGRVAVAIELSRRFEHRLLHGPGQPVEVDLAIPRAVAVGTARSTGHVVVKAPAALRISAEPVQLRAVAIGKAMAGVPSLFQGAPWRDVLAYSFGPTAASVALELERRRPQIEARQLLDMTLKDGRVRYVARFHYDILYSGVQAVRIDLPAAVASKARCTTSGVRETVIDPPPADLDAGVVAWELSGQAEFIGPVVIELTWDDELGDLPYGQAVEVNVPVLSPRGTDRAWGQVVLRKAETIDWVPVAESSSGVRPIDPQMDLMAGAAALGVARALEFQGAWSLSVSATRYKLQELKRTSVERAFVRAVMTRGGQVAMQVLYRLRSARQRLAIQLPDAVEFDREPLRINGTAVGLEQGDKNTFYIPLTGRDAESAWVIDLRYNLTDAAIIAPPVFSEDPAVQKVYMCIYLPEERALSGYSGPWNPEMQWGWTRGLNRDPHLRRSPEELINWIGEGIALPADWAAAFQVAGRPHLFSALQPQAPPDGGLRLFAWSRTGMDLAVIGAVIAVGVVFLRRPASARVGVIGVAVAAALLCAIFLPTLATQLLDGTLGFGTAGIVLLWVVHHVTFVRPRDPVVQARIAARQAQRIAAIEAKAKPQPPGPSPHDTPDAAQPPLDEEADQ
jgi:hypothetical protein